VFGSNSRYSSSRFAVLDLEVWLQAYLVLPNKAKEKLIVSPTSFQVHRNWFRVSQLATIVAIGLRKLYAKSEFGIRQESCYEWWSLTRYDDGIEGI
jgi:hypothetical protein